MHKEFKSLPLNRLEPGRFQPRQDFNEESLKELAESILSQGLLEPLLVRELAQGRYEIIAGERRFRAAKLAGLTEVPCLIGFYTDEQACAATLIENIQRQDLNLIEEATAYKRLLDEFHFHQDELGALVGKSRSHIANILRLLTLEVFVKECLINHQFSMGHARLLVGLPPPQQQELAESIIAFNWSVRQLEQEVKQRKSINSELKNPQTDRDISRLQTLLSEQVGAPVQIINDSRQGGWLQIKFFDNDTLAGLLDKFGLSYD